MENNPARRPFLVALYRQYLETQDTAGFIRKSAGAYTQGTLQRLAEHDGAEVRRAAVLALGFLGDYGTNATLGRALQDEDRAVRMIAENSIRNVWTRAGSDDERRALAVVLRLNSAQHYEEAIRRATELVVRAPWFAEAWNQRAIARFSMKRFAECIDDCHQTLELNPYHFGAAAGMGQSQLQLGQNESALESFRRALGLNPDMEAVRAQIARLTRLIEGR